MLRQYFEMKSRVPDAILLYRMGDFYEMFFEDAKDAAPLLGIALTARNKASDIEAPMCGVPHQSVDHHIARLVAAGRKVAVCDQVEDARAAKGLVRRDITRVVTPGTVLDEESLDPGAPSYLAALLPDGREAWGIALLDLSTGRLHAGRVPSGRVEEVLSLFRPREILLPEGAEPPARHDGPESRRSPAWMERAADPPNAPEGLVAAGRRAAAAALAYAGELRPGGTSHVRPPEPLRFDERMGLDPAAVATLELFASSDGDPQRSLCHLLDRTRTPIGSRLLRDALSRPSIDAIELQARWDAVEELLEKADARAAIQAELSGVGDLERRFARISAGVAGPREVVAWAEGIRRLSRLPDHARDLRGCRLRGLIDDLPDTTDLVRTVERTLVPEPPAGPSPAGAIGEGADAELDSLRALRRDAQGAMLAVEAEERERSGIASLKVRYNRVFGYSFEVSNSQREKVPEGWTRRQSLANAERYVTPALKQLEERILTAEDRIAEIETRLYTDLLASLAKSGDRAASAAARAGALDLLSGLAEIAAAGGWVRPVVTAQKRLAIRAGRHPLVEALRREEPFVPNDCDLSERKRILLVTGPNMGGKSTYLRQVATAVLLAQAGSFVPAEAMEFSLVDRIFTRVGAADHLARGESTFMVEMLEAASILRDATPASLVILDEVGRGTSTFDGLSLAWAILEHLHDTPGKDALVLFATHYHELTEIALVRPAVSNATMAVREAEGRVVFLRKVVPGAADRSYGIHVAELAGLPPEVTRRAREILANLERQELDVQGAPVLARREGESAGSGQMLLFSGPEAIALEKLREADFDRMTPIAALALLSALQERVKSGS
jgi:DNA mismatch repair protein MutS